MNRMSKTTGNNRVSALKRLTKPMGINNANRRQLSGSTNASINDARQLLANRNKSAFDARQLLSRQSSKTLDTANPTNIIVRKNLVQMEGESGNRNGKMVVVTGLKDMKIQDGRIIQSATSGGTQTEKRKNIFAVGPSTFVTIRNNSNTIVSSNQSTEKISLTKTITNTSVRREDDDGRSRTTDNVSSLSDKKVVISFVNDKYQQITKPPPPPPITTATSSSSSLSHRRASPPIIKRLHDASIQTSHSSSLSRSPIRTSSHRRQPTIDDYDHSPNQSIDDDPYEPPVKRTTSSSRKTTTTTAVREQPAVSTGSVKRTSTGAPVSTRMSSSVSAVPKPTSTTSSNSGSGTILVTNLQPSVTEEDVVELFNQIGRINEITTLSPGCIQIVYAKREHGEQAVTRYHNRLLDGQFMYVSLQQPSSYSTVKNSSVVSTQKATSNTQQPTKENGTSANSSSSTNQPLKLNSTNNSSSKIVIDPAFIRQALFHPSNNSTNPVQFQVKL